VKQQCLALPARTAGSRLKASPLTLSLQAAGTGRPHSRRTCSALPGTHCLHAPQAAGARYPRSRCPRPRLVAAAAGAALASGASAAAAPCFRYVPVSWYTLGRVVGVCMWVCVWACVCVWKCGCVSGTTRSPGKH